MLASASETLPRTSAPGVEMSRMIHVGAVSLAHQASRKAISAQVLIAGLRPTGGEGGHRHVADDAAAELADIVDADDLDGLERLRRTRNQADYGDDAAVITSHAELALATAGRVVASVTTWFQCEPSDAGSPTTTC